MSVKVSVCMITYNHERFIAQAVESALMQEADFDYEIVIGEDCSTDRTREILIELRERHPNNIRLLLRASNIGAHRNSIETLMACRGEYIAFLDGDDYWTCSSKLQKQVDYLDARPNFAMCGHRYRYAYENGSRPTTGATISPKQKEVCTTRDVMAGYWLLHSSVMARRCMIPRLPDWYYEFNSGDTCMQLLCSQFGRLGCISEVMTAYRIHSGGLWSATEAEDKAKSLIPMYERFNEYLDGRYTAELNLTISTCYRSMSWSCERRSDYRRAREYFITAMSHLPPIRWLSLRLIHSMIRLWLPRFYAFSRADRLVERYRILAYGKTGAR